MPVTLWQVLRPLRPVHPVIANCPFIAQTNPRSLFRRLSLQSTRPNEGGTGVNLTSVAGALATCAITIAATPAAPPPAAHAKNGDTHITGMGLEQVLDCNDSTLIVNGTLNIITAKGSCWAVSVMGSSNTVIADNVVNDITVYGYDETVFYKGGDPVLWDRGRELGMVNRLQRVGS
jgi:hypothetical protein